MAASKARLFVCLPMTFLADETRVTVREVERERRERQRQTERERTERERQRERERERRRVGSRST
jgi:hypothetical protein